MSKQEVQTVIEKASEIEKLLSPTGGSFMPDLKTIHTKEEFLRWKGELRHHIQKLKPAPLVVDILHLLENSFKNGFTDEQDFRNLRSKLETLNSHLDEYYEESDEETTMPVNQRLKKGTTIKTAFDEYTLIGQVGQGGNGRVFSASNTADQQVAIKLVERNVGSDKLKRFKNEISFCEHHKHKNIVSILDRGYVYLDSKDYVFYFMPLYADTLKNKIKVGVPHEKVLDIFVGLLEGLKFAHEHGSIHRDIKPENIMFANGSWIPVICDFGIAHFAEEDLLTVVETKGTDRMANFQYAAPEQRKRNGEVCFQTDIYALALILNEMFTGEIPQAAGHKRIASIAPDYKYLDDLFDQLFKQEPTDRLYPELSILSEMKRLAEQYQRNEEKERLKAVVNEVIEPEDFKPLIVDIEYKKGGLHFILNTVLPDDWFQMLTYGMYDHSCVMGYHCNRLQKFDKNTLFMPLYAEESTSTIKTIVNYVKSWVDTVSRKYSQEAKRQAIAEQRRKEEARKAEIKRIEKEAEVNSTINAALKELL